MRRVLTEFMGLREEADERKRRVLLDFHFYNYTFCRESAFDHRQTSTCMELLRMTLERDASSDTDRDQSEASFAFLTRWLLLHSVERPPRSVGIFCRADVQAIVDHALLSYYRQIGAYRAVLCDGVRRKMVQQHPNGLEPPSKPAQLREAACEGTLVFAEAALGEEAAD